MYFDRIVVPEWLKLLQFSCRYHCNYDKDIIIENYDQSHNS